MPAPTDWTAIAKARGLDLPAEQLARVVEPLRTLESVFRPLTLRIPSALQPAIFFRADLERTE
jgi:hypothetical protein